MNSELG